MITKFLKYIKEELDYGTLTKASKKLKEMGHASRAKSIDDHKSFHGIKMEMMGNYPDLEPFEVYARRTGGGFYENSTHQKVTVYLSTWHYIPSDESECEGVSMSAAFITNSKEELLQDKENWKEHKLGVDSFFNTESMVPNFEYYNDEFSFTSWEGKNDHDYIKFTNRRDAVRFRNLLRRDKVFKKMYKKATEGCPSIISPLEWTRLCHQNVTVNMLYKTPH